MLVISALPASGNGLGFLLTTRSSFPNEASKASARNQSFLSDGNARVFIKAFVGSATTLTLAPASTGVRERIMNFHPPTFNLMLSDGESYAHAARGNIRYSCTVNGGSDANLFHYPITLGSLADLSSDSEVEIIEAIGMHMFKKYLCISSASPVLQ